MKEFRSTQTTLEEIAKAPNPKIKRVAQLLGKV